MKTFFFFFLGGGGPGRGGGRGGSQGGCEQRIEVFVKIKKTTRIDVYETLCPQQMLVHKGGKIKNGVGSAEMSHLQNRCLKISG